MTEQNEPVPARVIAPETLGDDAYCVPPDLAAEAFNIVERAGWHAPDDCPANRTPQPVPSWVRANIKDVWAWVALGASAILVLELLGWAVWAFVEASQ